MRWLLPLAALLACRHKPPPNPDGDGTGALDPARALQIAVVIPSQIPANAPTTVRIAGSGFEAGARVDVGGVTQVAASSVNANEISAPLPALPAGVYDVTVANTDGESATLRGGLTVGGAGYASLAAGCASVTVYFALDQAALTDESRSTLTSRLSCWTGDEGPLTVEGHADERGTTDYNLALGNRRAETVRQFLSTQGVAAARIRAVSWGEERPADTGHTEAAWAANRRGVVLPGR
jgi:peptidoglycan-associated lipoprotein